MPGILDLPEPPGFQEDSVHALLDNDVRGNLDIKLQQQLYARRGAIARPSRSPDVPP